MPNLASKRINCTSKPIKQAIITLSCLLILITISDLAPASAQETYVSTTGWWQTDNLNGPHGVAVDADDNIYVADSYSNSIIKYSNSGQFITQWGRFGQSNGCFNEPSGVAVDETGNVYVADTYNNRIHVFSNQGQYLRKIGSDGAAEAMVVCPRGIATDQSGFLYVADTSNNRIAVFSTSGQFKSAFGGSGSGNGKFSNPEGISIDKDGNIFVADTGNSRIQKFTNDGMYLTQWGSRNDPDPHFDIRSPRSIAIDLAGNVYVTDSENSRIMKYSNNGSFLIQIGGYGTSQGAFNLPMGVILDGKGFLIVADTFNNRIQKFLPTYNAEIETAAGTAKFSTTAGPIQVAIITEESISTEGKPNDLQFPNGLFSLKIMGLEPGQTVTIDIELPSDVPIGSKYWKYQDTTGWFPLPIGSDDGDNKITLSLTDGELGDADGMKNAVIVDPGGPAIPKGLFKVPEVPWGTSLLTMFLALAAITIAKRSMKTSNNH